MCHLVGDASDWQCPCGYEFGQNIDQVLELLRDQRANARILLGLLVIVDLAAVFGVVYLALHGIVIYPVLGFAALLVWTGRVARKLSVTRESLRQLAKRELPKATLHKAPD